LGKKGGKRIYANGEKIKEERGGQKKSELHRNTEKIRK